MKKNKLLAVLLALVMTLSLLPTTALADENNTNQEDTIESASADSADSEAPADSVAAIGENGYATLAKAVEAAKDGDTVKLLKDVTLTNTITISEGTSVTLDLNGKTITADLSGVRGSNSVIDTDDVSLEIKDSVGTGKIVSDEYGITASNGGTITVTSGTIEANYAALSGNNTTGDMNFVINGGTLTSTLSEAIYMPGQQELNITDGTLNGGISARMGQINISGGTINGMTSAQTADPFESYWNYSGSAWIGDAIYVWGGTYTSSNAEYGNSCTINITGGTINGNAHNAIAVYDIANKYDQTIEVNVSGDAVVNGTIVEDHTKDQGTTDVSTTWNITGGTFSSDPSAYLANGFSAIESSGAWRVSDPVAQIDNVKYGALAAAIAAAQPGDTVKLLKDATLEGQNFNEKGFVLDLNQKTLTVTGQLLFYYSTTFKNGTIDISGVKHQDGLLQAYGSNEMTLTFDSVTVKQDKAEGDRFVLYVFEAENPNAQMVLKDSAVNLAGSIAFVFAKNGGKSLTVSNSVINYTGDNNINVFQIFGGSVSGKTINAPNSILVHHNDEKLTFNNVSATAGKIKMGVGDVEITGDSHITLTDECGTSDYLAKADIPGTLTVKDTSTLTCKTLGGKLKIADTCIVKRTGTSDFTYTIMNKANLTDGTYLSDPTGATAPYYYVTNNNDGTWTVYYSAPSTGGSSNTTTTTEKNPDGSTTTTTTDKTTGTVTEVTKETDGSTTTVETKKDGTVTETVKTPEGTTGTVVTDKTGEVTEVKSAVSTKAATEAAKTGEAVTLPVEVPAVKTTEDAPAVEVTVPKSAGSVKVEIPVEKVTPGTVAVIVNADGTEKIVSTSVVTENGVALTLEGSATVKIIDNAKDFADVPENNVFYNEIASLSAREIMIGKTDEKFDLYSSVTLNQIANVAGRITGAVDVKDFKAGIDWGTENGLKTGNAPATRGEVLEALYISAGTPAVEDTSILARFSDSASIPADMAAIAAWAAQNGILKGTADGTADLSANVTRGQACALAGRTMGALA